MRCPNCGLELSTAGGCEECGWVGELASPEQQARPVFAVGQTIADHFIVVEATDTTLAHAIHLYLAEDQRSGGQVTIKVATSGTPAAQWLVREYEIVHSLSNVAAPQALDLIDREGSTLLVVQHLGGCLLNQAWSAEGVTEAKRLEWLVQLCNVLSALHAQDIVCLAVHPEQLVVTANQEVALPDLSHARRLPIDPADRLAGFEYYSAPEVFLASQEVNPRADIYGFGATWYSLLVGKPLGMEHFEEMFFVKPPLEFVPDLVPATNRTVVKAMQRSAARRQKSMLYVKDALEEIKKQLDRQPSPTVGVYSDTGLVRDANEDSSLVEEFLIGDQGTSVRCGLYMISDGMGGEAGGAVASQLVTKVIAEAVMPRLRSYSLQHVGEDLSGEVGLLLEDAVNRASTTVYERARAEPLLKRMGATAVIAVVLDRQLYVANVGDSRAYGISQDAITQLTRDHTVIAQLIERGELDARQAHSHPAQGELTRNIGAKPRTDTDLCHRELNAGDTVLLCCDGLTDVVEEHEIKNIVLSSPTYQAACHRLVNLAISRGGPDNITVMVTGLGGGSQ